MMNYRLKVMSMTSCDLFFGENDPPIVTSWPHLHQHINNDVGGNDGEEEDGNDGDDDDGNDGDGHLSIGINVGQKSSSREKCRHQGNAREDVLIISIIPPNDDDDYLPVEDKEDGEGPLKTDARHICPRHTSWSDLKCHISLIIDHHHHNHFDRTSASVLGAWC